MASLTPGAVEDIINENLTVAGGHRPVLQVVKFATFTTAEGHPRERLWLSDGGRWIQGTAKPQDGRVLTPGCFVRLLEYVPCKMSVAVAIYAKDFDIVSPAQPRVGTPTQYRNGAALPADAVQPPAPPPPPPTVEEVEATFATATLSAATPTIQLNVGGTVFETTESTLARHPATFFGALARNRGAATRLFVDRDPTHFRHVLNYLRSGVVTAPADDDAKAELLLELEFYALHDFARGLCGPVLDLTKHLDAAGVLEDRADEARLRHVFASGDAGAIGRLDRYEGLVDFYSTYPGGVAFAAPPAVDAGSTLLYDALEPKPPLGREGSPATCQYIDQFKENFDALYPQVLTRLSKVMKSGQVFIAGGSVLLGLTALDPAVARLSNMPLRTRHTAFWKANSKEVGDVDVFVCAQSPEECTILAERIWNALAVDGEFWKCERNRGVINMTKHRTHYCYGDAELVVQVVLRQYASLTEVLTCFDVDCCCVGLSLKRDWRDVKNWRVWALPRAVRALQSGRNVVNAIHAWPRSPAYEMRLTKYACRGFAVLCPGLDPASIDEARVRGESFEALSGVARLLRVANLVELALPTTFEAAKKLMIQRFGMSVTFALSGIYDVPVHLLPGEELAGASIPSGNEFSEVASALHPDSTAEEVAALRRRYPRDTAWRVLTPAANFQGGDRQYGRLVEADADSRAAVMRGIFDAGHDHLDLPRRIEWDDSRNQREYLNVRDADHDAIYYAHAYKV